jgi:16S rRNA U516 pseudouridylate synthase RsuA-like enzyme
MTNDGDLAQKLTHPSHAHDILLNVHAIWHKS